MKIKPSRKYFDKRKIKCQYIYYIMRIAVIYRSYSSLRIVNVRILWAWHVTKIEEKQICVEFY
jgi:hypothetical protein